MGKTAKRSPGDKLGKWILKKQIGGGGNGTVWQVTPETGGEDCALKLLKRTSNTIFRRFIAEINALQKATSIEGVIRLIDQDLHFNADAGPRWYVMPLAETAGVGLAEYDAVGIVDSFVRLARTLSELHALGIHHRDIKLSNILFLGGRLCLSDFGLVKYPGRADLTQARESLGPKLLMAPEMRRDAQSAAGAPADVYSFAKTLWVALTGRKLAFDGQYVADGGLELAGHHRTAFFGPLDKLLAECTTNDPLLRPPMSEVERRLAEWVSMMNDFHSRNLTEWVYLQNRLFSSGFPQRVVWTGISDICDVLRLAAGTGNLNHVMLPSGGGQDLTRVELASETGFLRLTLGSPVVVKPQSLSFESFGPGSPWNYFRLEAEHVLPSGTSGAILMPDGIDELVCELKTGGYIAREAWETGEHLGEPLPDGTRPVTRVLKGAFVIVAKRSWYNLAPETYDGRHQRLTGQEFRDYIAWLATNFPEAPPSR